MQLKSFAIQREDLGSLQRGTSQRSEKVRNKSETEKDKMTEENIVNRSELLEQKRRVEEKIRRAERKEIDDRIVDSLRKIQDINNAVADLQYSLNTIWKRSKQVEEELNEIIAMPSIPSHQKIYPQ